MWKVLDYSDGKLQWPEVKDSQIPVLYENDKFIRYQEELKVSSKLEITRNRRMKEQDVKKLQNAYKFNEKIEKTLEVIYIYDT